MATLMLLWPAADAAAQQPAPDPQPAQAPPIEERVEVVGVTPIHGIGLPAAKVPANVQVFTATDVDPALTLDVPALVADRAAGVQVSDAQAGTFQPDLLFRGFAGSPLLGASQGLAVYQDGVRINDPFGDTIHWDLLPPAAIASINLMPGSNPLFGLNALGGALSIRTKDGFDFPGHRVSFTTGSFARHHVEAQSGGHGERLAYFTSATVTDERGWRDFSPSTVRRVFGDLAWRGATAAMTVSATAASNRLTGNGPAPLALLEEERDASFTHPDRTDNDGALVTVDAQRRAAEHLLVEAVAYYRYGRTRTFNGDAADEDEGPFDAVNNLSDSRGRGAGASGQLTRTTPLAGRDNHFIAGAGVDAAGTEFHFASERAQLTADRGTTRTGIFDEDAAVHLHSAVLTASAFLTNTWSVTRTVGLSVSARINWTRLRLRDRLSAALTGDHRFARVNPAAGVTWQARPSVTLYGSYAQSSRAPTPVELTCADPDDPCRLPNAFVSDPPLDQVTAGTWEAGVRHTRAPLRWTVAAFTTGAAGDIIFVSSGALRGEGHFENVDRTRRRGVEVSAEYERAGRLSAVAAYTWQRATFGTNLRIASRFHPAAERAEIVVAAGDRLPGVPAHAAKLALAATLTDRLGVGVNVRAQSGHVLRGDEANLLPPVPGHVILTAHARRRLTDRLAAVVQAQNLLDARFYTFGVLGDPSPVTDDDDPRFLSPGAPRAIWGGIEVQF
ncbi:MAG: TonB-dependent receptor [Acidobacteria bacterium]|nr:TonB-dependent receptor [Acidobacteriota bacterium]